MKKGFTLVEVLVGVFLALIVFLGIFGAFYLSFRVIGLTERKITATQIAQGEIEKIRNLSYLQIGTVGAILPYASGTLEASTSTTINGIEYTIERNIKFISDPTDQDTTCELDYKRVEIRVSFSGVLGGQVTMTTDIAPKDIVEEAQACQAQPAGILSVNVFDAVGQAVTSPLIEIFDPQTDQLIDSVTPSSGTYDFPLSPGTSYRVVVSKSGYSSERTYGIDEVAIPQKPNPTVLEGQITQISFLIDRVSSMQIQTLSPWGEDHFSDSFLDESKISEKENTQVSGGQVTLSTTTDGYSQTGHIFSVAISPSQLVEWLELSFTDEKPAGTDLKYHVYFASGTEWYLIPDSDLPGNSIGFDSSPVDLSVLSTSTYPEIKLKANFSSNSTSQTPALKDWQVSWKNSLETPISNVTFDLRGEKLIGKDADENPIYKFSTSTQTDSQGTLTLTNLEWDVYHFSNFQKDSQNLNLVTSTPPHPISLNPNTNLEAKFYLESQNSLLVTIQDSSDLEPIFSASTTISASGFSQTEYTNEKGQALFIPLDAQTYDISVSAPGYSSTSTSVFVSGQTVKLIKLDQSD
jgi:type II secretory pathway pseudopilin PulG